MPATIPTSTFPPPNRPVTPSPSKKVITPQEEYNCPYCTTISKKSDRCPNCGAPRVK